jgi:prolyl oligopeptidase PreP (S9A serine peptidase family)
MLMNVAAVTSAPATTLGITGSTVVFVLVVVVIDMLRYPYYTGGIGWTTGNDA